MLSQVSRYLGQGGAFEHAASGRRRGKGGARKGGDGRRDRAVRVKFIFHFNLGRGRGASLPFYVIILFTYKECLHFREGNFGIGRAVWRGRGCGISGEGVRKTGRGLQPFECGLKLATVAFGLVDGGREVAALGELLNPGRDGGAAHLIEAGEIVVGGPTVATLGAEGGDFAIEEAGGGCQGRVVAHGGWNDGVGGGQNSHGSLPYLLRFSSSIFRMSSDW